MNQVLIAALILAIVSPVEAAQPKTIYQRQQEAKQRNAQAAKSARKGAAKRTAQVKKYQYESQRNTAPANAAKSGALAAKGRKTNPLTSPKTSRGTQMSREQMVAGLLFGLGIAAAMSSGADMGIDDDYGGRELDDREQMLQRIRENGRESEARRNAERERALGNFDKAEQYEREAAQP